MSGFRTALAERISGSPVAGIVIVFVASVVAGAVVTGSFVLLSALAWKVGQGCAKLMGWA